MQEIKKRRILLASVLKPVDEPRMFERMGLSLVAKGYDVFIAGLPSASGKPVSGIHFFPHQKFGRISIGRIKVRFAVLKKAFIIRPDIFIVSTHELLGVALFYRICTGKKIVYDIQENYWRNIMYTTVFPRILRPLIAFPVRLKEIITSPLFSKFLLAERCYEDELSFTKRKSVIIENKCVIPKGFQRKPSTDSIQLLFTGTIAESTGVFQAINLAKKLHEQEPRTRLYIIGYCAQSSTLEKIKKEISQYPFISIADGALFASHAEIMDAIATANYGVICYPLSPHLENKVPTKLYEYLSCRLPMLLQNHKPWVEGSKAQDTAIIVNFNEPHVASILSQMNTRRFYTETIRGTTWESEEKKLLESIDSI